MIRRSDMTDKKMKKIIKRDRRRRRAQGIGALAGTLTSFAVIALLFGGEIKNDAKKAKEEIKSRLDPEQKG